MSKISFTSDGYKLAGNLFTSKEPKGLAFLFIQGWTGHQNVEAAQALTNLGYTTMTYDMRGNRESEGNLAVFTRADFIQDATVAYDYLRKQVGADMPIGVVGSSFGSYTAILLSEKRKVYCLSLRVPASYPDQSFNEPQMAQGDPDGFIEWRKQKLDYTQNHAFKALHNFKGKVQILEAGADDLVPSQAPKNYADAIIDKASLTYEVVPNAPHRLANKQLQADYEKRLIAWVSTLLRSN
jgi:dienelactone hydrolase